MKKTKVYLPMILALVFLMVVLIGAFIINKNKKNNQNQETNKVSRFIVNTTDVLFEKNKNMCYSPLSLFVTMCNSAELVDDAAAEEIVKAFGYNSLDEMKKDKEDILEKITVTDIADQKILLADSLWVFDKYLTDYGKEMLLNNKKDFEFDIFCKEFYGADINEWIEEKTDGRITKFYEDNEELCLSLVNALVFDGEWRQKFASNTEGQFSLADGKEISVTYMLGNLEEMNAVDNNDYVAVQKEYLNGAGMILVLPKEKELDAFTTSENISSVLNAFSSGEAKKMKVDLTMPKFAINDEYEEDDIKKILGKIGVNKVFEINSWKKIVNSDNVLTKQETVIAADEWGTKAAAVTSVGLAKPLVDKLTVKLDKPFLYVIEKDGIPLFIGTVYNPAE